MKHLTYGRANDLTTGAGVDSHNNQIERLVNDMNDNFEELLGKLGQAPSVAKPAQSQPFIPPPSSTQVDNPFTQQYDQNGVVILRDTREVNIMAPLVARRTGVHKVDITLSQQFSENAVYIPAMFGGWTCLNEVMPIPLWGSSLHKIRVEFRFSYLNSTRGIVFRVSPNPNNIDAADFVIESSSNGSATDTTVWCLKMKGLNEVTVPAPVKNAIHQFIAEFDGTNVGVGTAQWKIWIDGSLQTATNLSANNVGTVPQAFRLTWESNYSNPTFGTSATGSAPPLIFDGVISECRVFTDITGVYSTEPAYSACVGDWRTSDMVQATYTDTGVITMHQSSSGQPLSGSANIYICTGNSIPLLYPSVAPNLSGLVPITIPVGGLAHGFPGTLSIQTTAISQPIPTYNVYYAVITPNVARIKNKAFPDEDRYDLFHIPVSNSNPLGYPPFSWSPIHTLRGISAPEPFIGANQ